MIVSIIACMDNRCGIGKDGGIPWHFPADMKRFKEVTMTRPVIMGRVTWESLPVKPLPGRRNIVVTSRAILGVECVPSLEMALELCRDAESKECFIIGGERLYKDAIPIADRMYLTAINHDYGCDRFFPEEDYEWETLESFDMEFEHFARHVVWQRIKQ